MAGLLYVRTGNGGSDPLVAIEDLGIRIATGPSWTLLSSSAPGAAEGSSGQFTARELRDSRDLWLAITGGSLQWSKDGATVELAANYLADYQLMQDFTDDFLDLSGGGLVLPNNTTTPASGVEGQIFWDNDDDEMFVWNGTIWVSMASLVASGIDHGLLQGLADDDHSQYLLLNGSEVRNQVTGSIDMGPSSGYFILPQATDVSVTFTAGSEGALAWDTNDDTLYAHDGTQWFAIASISGVLTDHGGLTGLLDDDHPQYGHLAQNENVSGLWTFDPVTATDPSIILAPNLTLPTTNVVDGAIATVSGILYSYDASRGKFLSIDRKLLIASKSSKAKDVYLRVGDGIASSQTGIRALRAGTITGMFLETDSAFTWILEIRRNGTLTVIASLASGGAQGSQSTTTNVDFNQGDELQFYANTSGSNIDAPIGGIEIAWRG